MEPPWPRVSTFVAMARALLPEPDLMNRIKADGDAHR